MSETQDSVNKRRKQRRRKIVRRRIIKTLIFLLVVALAVFVVLALTVLFPVKNVSAKGSKLYTEAQIVKASGINKEDNIFTLSSARVEEDIHKILPYIDTVKIDRKLPDTVSLSVTDAKEYESYYSGGKYYAVSKRGYVLNQYDKPPEDTFVIKCKGVSAKVGYKIDFKSETTGELVNMLKAELEKQKIKLNAVDISDEYDIKLTVDDRFEVRLGTDKYLENKVAHLESMIESIGEGRQGTINLTMWTKDKSEGTFTENSEE